MVQGEPSFLVLVVEDEILLAMHLEEVLLADGWLVMGPVNSVQQALHLLEEDRRPDVALLDINVRGKLVTPVAEVLRKLNIPFVLSTAYGNPEAFAEVFEGAPQVSKPFDSKRLLSTLHQVCPRR